MENAGPACRDKIAAKPQERETAGPGRKTNRQRGRGKETGENHSDI